MQVVLTHAQRVVPLVVLAEGRGQSGERLAVSPALLEVGDVLTKAVGDDSQENERFNLTIHPEEKTVLALQTVYLNVLDLDDQNDLEDQSQSQLVDSVENIHGTKIHHLRLLLVEQVIEARLQVLAGLEGEFGVLVHAPKTISG